ncbi:MAG: 50S ribosomal protein L11 methyltransferase [Bacteroidia bacterium]|nr:50S ribosomal protein L11 methyltransferase [Bacteroidia bacterium]
MEKINNYWSMTEGAFNCLIDDERTKAFNKAIKNTVKKGDVVVDMGSGSGVLAMLAADCGAKKVYAVELDKKNTKTLSNTFRNNNLENIVTVLEGDVRTIKIPEKVDVIIGEMIATGLIEELQIPAMNNIIKYGNKNVKVLLNKIENFIDLVYNNNSYYGHKFNIIRYEYPDLKKLASVSFTKPEKYSVVDFSKQNKKNKINVSTEFEINKKGIINALRISSKTIFYDNSTVGATFAYCYPILLPIEEQRVEKGDKFMVYLSYTMCEGFDTLNYSVNKKQNVK